MAIGVSPRWQAQLNADLATGAPIFYRRVPGNRNRTYFNPRTGQEVSEHYVLRIYRPALEAAERQAIREEGRRSARRVRVQLSSIVDTWRARQESLGNVYTRQQARANPEFQQLYVRLRQVSYQARAVPISDAGRRASLYASDGEYAQLLVSLGRRLPDAGFPVGESALQVNTGGSYINEVVLPALRSQ